MWNHIFRRGFADMNRTGTIVVKFVKHMSNILLNHAVLEPELLNRITTFFFGLAANIFLLACADQPDQHTDRHPDTGRPAQLKHIEANSVVMNFAKSFIFMNLRSQWTLAEGLSNSGICHDQWPEWGEGLVKVGLVDVWTSSPFPSQRWIPVT